MLDNHNEMLKSNYEAVKKNIKQLARGADVIRVKCALLQ